MDLRKAKPPKRKYEGLEVAGPGARRTDGRIRSLAGDVRRLLDRLYQELLNEEIERLYGKLRKETVKERIIRQLAQALSRGGIRQIEDAGRREDKDFKVTPSFMESYFQDKLVEVQGIEENIRREFQANMAKVIGQMKTENPGVSIREMANRLREEVYLSGVDVKNPPTRAQLQALPTGPKVTQNVYGRAALIAQTEIGRANNAGAMEAIEAAGFEYKMWISRPMDGGRGHQDMNGVIVPVGEPFILPDKTEMMRPHDPNAPLRHRIRCKCSIVAAPPSEVRRAIREGRLKV